MKSINEYLLDISSNNEILNIISEVLNNEIIDENVIKNSFLFEDKSLNFNPKNEDELKELLNIEEQDRESIDAFNDEWIKFKHSKFKDYKIGPWPFCSDDWSGLPNTLKPVFNNLAIALRSEGFCLIHLENQHNKGVKAKIKYDFTKSFFDNVLDLFNENKVLFYQFVHYEDIVDKNNDKFVFDKDELKDYKEINLEDILKSKSDDNNNSDKENKSSEENIKDTVTDQIKNNKDLLTPLAKEANITGEKLRDIITKVCLDKKGKPRKLDESVILGLSIMLCGVILTIKKSGKSDNAAILAVTNKITSIVKNKKSIKNTI